MSSVKSAVLFFYNAITLKFRYNSTGLKGVIDHVKETKNLVRYAFNCCHRQFQRLAFEYDRGKQPGLLSASKRKYCTIRPGI